MTRAFSSVFMLFFLQHRVFSPFHFQTYKIVLTMDIWNSKGSLCLEMKLCYGGCFTYIWAIVGELLACIILHGAL